MSLTIPVGLQWHAHVDPVTSMASLEARLDGLGPGHGLDAGGTDAASWVSVTQGILAAGRYYFRSPSASMLGRWERERPLGGLYVLQASGGVMNPAGVSWTMWVEGGAWSATSRATPPEPASSPAGAPPPVLAPAPRTMSSRPLWLALAVALFVAVVRKGGA